VTINIWILLNLLIQPTHNTIVISLWVLLRSCLAHVDFISPLDSIDFFYVIAKSGYFSLGNSNNLNTIQVHSGMVGINELNEPIVAVLLFSSTFSSIVFWLLHIAENLEYLFVFNVLILILIFFNFKYFYIRCNRVIIKRLVFVESSVVIAYTLSSFFQKEHLFVWSVFAPKLIYLLFGLIVDIVLFFFISLVSMIRR
jgi:hypothetical protein